MTGSHPVLRGLGRRIVLALGLVVLVIVGGQITFRVALGQRVVDLDTLAAAIAHRALAGEIAASAGELLGALGRPGERLRAEQVGELVRDFERSEQDLRAIVDGAGIAQRTMRPLLLTLEPRFRTLHRAARQVVAAAEADAATGMVDVLPTADDLVEAGRQVVHVMDKIVAHARWEVQRNVTRLHRVQLWVLGMMVMALGAVVLGIIRPALLAVAAAFGEFDGLEAQAAARQAGLEGQLAETTARLAQATEETTARTAFLTQLSRDLRRRMASLPAVTALAEESGLPPAQRRYAASLQALVDRLERLTRDVLDLSEIEVGVLALNPLQFALRETIAGALAIVAPDAALRGLELRHEIEPDVPEAMIGDGVRLKQVVGVLVALTLDQTLDGPVTTHVRGKCTEAGPWIVDIEVHSDSAPLPREAQGLLTSGAAGRSTRLGLGATARLAHMLGEGIFYEPNAKPPVLRLSVRLEAAAHVAAQEKGGDAAPVDAPPAAPVTATGVTPPAERLQILVVDVEELTRALTVVILQRQGYCVVAAGDGDAALAALEDEEFDLVLMDVEMPKLDGYQTTAAIRERERPWGRHLPVLALTADALAGERCLAAGMDGHLAKPVRLQDLAEAMARFEPEPVAPEAANAPIGPAQLTARAPDAAAALVLARSFAEQSRRTLDAIRDGLAARETDRVTRGALRLRGTLAGLGASAASQAARRLETMARAAAIDQAGEALAALETRVEEIRAVLEAASGAEASAA